MDSQKVKLVLEKYEAEILPDTAENAVVVARSGKVYRCYGTLNGVYPNVDLGDELKGAVVTHNHPPGSNNEWSFSDDDIKLFMDYNLSVLRGIDEKYVYELTRDSSEIDEHMTFEELILSEDSAQHERIIDVAIRNGIGYRRRKRE